MYHYVSGAMKMRDMKMKSMIKVYFESGYASEEVAMFNDEETYIACLPSLKELARKQKWERVTEGIDD